MLSKMPTFNLRHFMAHLAPGAYCGLQVFFLLVGAVYLCFPELLEKLAWIGKLGTATSALIGFLIITVCYFIGVVIRLRPVGYLDEISIEYNLRRRLAEHVSLWRRPRLWVSGFVRWVFPSKSFWSCIRCTFRWKIVQRIARLAETSVYCSEVIELLNEEKSAQRSHKGVTEQQEDSWCEERARLLEELGKEQSPDCRSFHDWIREQAVEAIREFEEKQLDEACPDARKDWKRRWRWLNAWIWHADEFPYPLWRIYTTYRYASAEDLRVFKSVLMPEMLETMHGEVSTKAGHSAFNRSKLLILEQSEKLATLVYDAEALVRMVNGFYQPLSWGARISFWIVVILVSLTLIAGFIPASDSGLGPFGEAGVSPNWVYVLFGFLTLFLCNYLLSRGVVAYFDHLRNMEAHVLFDALWVLRSATHHGALELDLKE